MKELLDIHDRVADLKDLHKRLTTLEIGIRAVTVMYDEHSKDKDSKDNIFRLKENFCYRLTGAKHQYLLLLREIGQSEANLTHLAKHQPNQLTGYYSGNPHFDQIEEMLSSIFDSCIFQITSAVISRNFLKYHHLPLIYSRDPPQTSLCFYPRPWPLPKHRLSSVSFEHDLHPCAHLPLSSDYPKKIRATLKNLLAS